MLEDLRASDSLLWSVINYRNDVLHGRREPDDAPELAAKLGQWLRRYRDELGW